MVLELLALFKQPESSFEASDILEKVVPFRKIVQNVEDFQIIANKNKNTVRYG